MDATQFAQQARQDPHLNAFLQEIAADVAGQVAGDEPQRYFTVTGADILVTVVAYALYRWLKDYFDHRRALHEAEILGRQQQVIAALIRDGFQPKEAQAVTQALLRRIAQRTADDPLLKAAAGLVGKGS